MVFLLFFTAVVLSGIAAYYSVIGLIAIFSAAALPVAIMGGSLEIAKLVVASWLYRYWEAIPRLMKVYFTTALIILMLITSMGIFGFLSKAHSDQSLISGDVQSKISLYDEKIKTQKDNIEANRKALQQMDAQVDARLNRSDSEQGAERAVQIRRQQAAERAKLQKEIADAQKEISKLQNERAPIAAEIRKVEAEVGPIKYIAAMVYGDNPDENTLEKSVRWLIILLICVFDPLAVLMLIAANLTQIKQKEWKEKTEVAAQESKEIPIIESKEDIKNDDNNSYKVIPDQSVMPVAAEATATSSTQSADTTNVVALVEPTAPVEKVGVKKKVVKKVSKKTPVKKVPAKKTKAKPVAKKVSKKKTTIAEPEIKIEPKVTTEIETIPEPVKEPVIEDKSSSQGFVPKPVTVEQEIQSMIDSNDQQGLEQVYKQIVKELAKKNRNKSTHWGPIKNTKNG